VKKPKLTIMRERKRQHRIHCRLFFHLDC